MRNIVSINRMSSDNGGSVRLITNYRISTITAVGSVGTNVNIAKLFDNVDVRTSDGPVRYLEHVDNRGKTRSKGLRTTKNKRQKKSKNNDGSDTAKKTSRSRHFDNQVTIVMNIPIVSSSSEGAASFVNMKVFCNGNVQMTGVKTIEQCERSVKTIADIVKKADAENASITTSSSASASEAIAENQEQEQEQERGGHADDGGSNFTTSFRVCLINSDYKIGWQVRRDRLYDLLTAKYDLICGYEPCVYPGVKMQYAWNRESDPNRRGTSGEGTCECKKKCDGKGFGNGNGDCRRITVAVFRSGCIIVTGAHTYEQLDDAYCFVRNLLDKHKDHLQNVPAV